MKSMVLFTDFSASAQKAMECNMSDILTANKVYIIHEFQKNTKGSTPMIGSFDDVRLLKVEKKLRELKVALEEKNIEVETILIKTNKWPIQVNKLLNESNHIILGRNGRGNAPDEKGSFFTRISRRLENTNKQLSF